MIRKRIALLLAATMALSSMSGTAAFAASANFSQAVSELTEAAPQQDTAETEVEQASAKVSQQKKIAAAKKKAITENKKVRSLPTETEDLELKKEYSLLLKNSGEEKWFSFTPTEDGWYSFVSYGEGAVDPSCEFYQETEGELEPLDNADDMRELHFVLNYRLEAGKTYYYCVKSYYNYDGSSFQVKLTKPKSPESVSADITAAKTQFVEYIEYVDISGTVLTVSFEESVQEEITFGTDDAIYDSEGNAYRYYLEKDSIVYFPYETIPAGTYELHFTCNYQTIQTKETFKVTITSLQDAKFQALKVGENKEVESSDEKYIYYTFAPTETGRYKFSPISSIIIQRQDEEGNIEEIDSTYVEEGICFELEKDSLYYVGLRGAIYLDETGSYKYTLNIEECSEIDKVSLDLSDIKTEFYCGLEEINLDGMKLDVTYKNQSSDSLTYDAGFGADKYGNQYQCYFVKQGDEEGELHYKYELSEEGVYEIVVYSNDEAIELEQTYTITLKKPENLPELILGKNEKVKSSENYGYYVWYCFKPSETATYGFKNLSNMCVYSETDDSYDFLSGKRKNDQMEYQMTGGTTYYVGFSGEIYSEEEDEYVYEFDLNIAKKKEIASVKLTSLPENLEFEEFLDRVKVGKCEVEVTYQDGTKETFTKEKRADEFGRKLKWELYTKDGEKAENANYPAAGEYVYRISFGGIYAEEEIPVTVKSLNMDHAVELEDKLDLENTGRMVLKYTAQASGSYEIKLNVPAVEMKVFMEDKEQMSVSSANAYRKYVNLTQDQTYYIYFGAKAKCKKLQLQIAMISRPEGMKTTVLKKTYIAGIDRFYYDDLQTEISLADSDTKRTITGRDEVEGYYLQYKITNNNEDEENKEIEEGEYLTVGEWTVTPYLSASIQTGSAVAVEMEDIPVTTTTIKAQKIDSSDLTVLEKDKWITVPNTFGKNKYYSFTAPEEGNYDYVLQTETNTGVFPDSYKYYVSECYREESDGYDAVEDLHYMEEGETRLIEINTIAETKIKVTLVKEDSGSSGGEVEGEGEQKFTLEEGMDKDITFEKKSLIAEFTPTQSGIYCLESSYAAAYEESQDLSAELYQYDEEEEIYHYLTDDDDSGKNLNFKLLYRLEAGKTYSYRIESYRAERPYHFHLSFQKRKELKIEKIRLVKNEYASEQEFDLTTTFTDSYAVEVTYDDGSKEIFSIHKSETETETILSGKVVDDFENQIFYSVVEQESAENTYTVSLSYQNYGGEIVETTETVKRKGIEALPEIKIGQNYEINAQKNIWGSKLFVPEKDGEYVLRCSKGDSRVQIFSWDDRKIHLQQEIRDELSEDLELGVENQGDNGYSVSLQAGKKYIVLATPQMMLADETFCIKEMTKELNGLKLLKTPNQKTILPDSWNQIALEGMQVEASYTDGTTETITYGETDSSGRYLYNEDVKWMSNGKCRIYVNLGNYQVSFDLEQGSWDEIPTLKAEQLISLDAQKKEIKVFNFVPEKSDLYRIALDNANLCDIYTEDGRVTDDIERLFDRYYMKEGETYTFYLRANETDAAVYIDPWLDYYEGTTLEQVREIIKDIPADVKKEDLKKYQEDRIEDAIARFFTVPMQDMKENMDLVEKFDQILLKVNDRIAATEIVNTSKVRDVEAKGAVLTAYDNSYYYAAKIVSKIEMKEATKDYSDLGTEVLALSIQFSLIDKNLNVKDEFFETYQNLSAPIQLEMKVPSEFVGEDVKLYHIKANGNKEEVNYEVTSDGKIRFVVDSFSDFVFAKNKKSQTSCKEHQLDANGWIVKKPATCFEEGEEVNYCNVCHVAVTRKIAKLAPQAEVNMPTNKSVPLKAKQSFQIKITGLAAGDSVVSYSVDKPKILSVSKTGKIKGKKAGQATVTVLLKSGLTRKIKIKVQKKEVITSSLSVVNAVTGKKVAKKVTMKAKEKLKLQVTVAPVTSKQKVTYASSNKKAVQITKKGLITAKKKGNATITIKSGKKSVKIKVKVK